MLRAARAGRTQEVKDFLAAGADYKIPNDFEETAVMFAARYGYLEIVQEFLARITDWDKQWDTALTLATIFNHNKIAQLLRAEKYRRRIKSAAKRG